MKTKCECGYEFEYTRKDIKNAHFVMCGDSTKREDVERLMDGKKANMVLTDPPYGIDLDTDWTGMTGSRKLKQRIGKRVEGHRYEKIIADDKYFDFKQFEWIECKEQFWWGADYYCWDLPRNGSWIIWDKRINENMDKIMGSAFEVLWSKVKHKKEIIRAAWAGAYGFHEDTKTRVHPTQKPIRVNSFVIEKYSNPDWIILDLFLGSGTTLVACEQTGRIGFGMEISEKYVAVTLQRLADMGLRPKLLTG